MWHFIRHASFVASIYGAFHGASALRFTTWLLSFLRMHCFSIHCVKVECDQPRIKPCPVKGSCDDASLPPSLPPSQPSPLKKTNQQTATTRRARTKGAETVLLGGSWVGLARTIHLRCIYGIFGREFIEYKVMYSVYVQFWPTLIMHASFSLIDVGSSFYCLCVGMARTMYIRCIYSIFGREFIKHHTILISPRTANIFHPLAKCSEHIK